MTDAGMQPLQPLTLPLHGACLIEASAGTGKTWTIAALVLRLVLGHHPGQGGTDEAESSGNAADAALRPLAPADILVMTFTRAATRELSERIRARLGEAATVLRGEQMPGDAFLAALCEYFAPGTPRQLAAWRAAQAAAAMDDASIFTIDAWCQRVLREHALAAGSPLADTLVADEAALRHDAVRDFWRTQVYPLPPADHAAWHAAFGSVDALAQAVSQCLPKLEATKGSAAAAMAEEGASVASVIHQARAEIAVLKHGWAERVRAIAAWLLPQATRTDKAKPFNGTKLGASRAQEWMDKLSAWAADPALLSPALTEKAWQRLTHAGITDALRDGATLSEPPPPAFDDVAALQEALERWMPLSARLLAFATGAVAQRLAELKQRQQVFGFADPLRRLDAALAGPDGEALRTRLLARYPVALIDEFQDTSPLQWRVFERLYQPSRPDPETALLLIGDPKQSIYGFRGADIYSYLQARRATAGRHYALDTNHRSTAALVGCVNALFEHAEQDSAQGAFALGKGQAMALPFVPVHARGRPERLVAGGAPVPAVTLCHDATLFKANELRRHHAALAAEQVVAWLGEAHFQRDGQPPQRLRPGDIAMLVRNRAEAQAVRRALDARGVRSVYLSDQSSVFDTPEALDLWRWLQAVAQPLDAGLARAAFATTTIGLPWDELAAHAQDEAAWDRRVELLRDLQRVWQRQGVLAMLRQALHRLGLPARLLAQSGGERSLTNLLHLAELLQAAGVTGEAALVRWLGERIAESTDGTGDGAGLGDERIVRLESDEGLVQVITVHKSKGLEYPVVMLPFAASLPRDVRDRVLSLPDPASGERRLVFAPAKADKAEEQTERLREDLRLLYVALTRARHALWLGVGLQKDRYASEPLFHRSGLGHLVVDGQPVGAAEVAGRLRQAFGPWAQDTAGVRWVDADLPPHPGRWVPDEADAPLAAVPVFDAAIDRDWAVGSYSSMVRGLAAVDATELPPPSVAWTPLLRDELDTDRGGASDEAAFASEDPPTTGSINEPATSAPWHRFPRGALPGNFLHDQLQWLAEESFDRLTTDNGRQALRRRCERAGHGERADDVLVWLQAIVTTPLPPLGAALADLRVQVPELEFWLPSAALDAPALDVLVQAHLLPGVPRPPLPARRLRGLLMGFADLVFEHAGRWWVLDYKSNALAPRADAGDMVDGPAQDRAYRTPVLNAAMAEHRYDVQAALYMAALHRLLRVRLGEGYDPARHLGGAVVLFLRGIAGPQRGCVWLPAPPALLQGIDAMLDAAEGTA